MSHKINIAIMGFRHIGRYLYENTLNSDIFNDVLADDYFDFIWCNGVLHHTKNPYKAFEIIQGRTGFNL